MTSRMLIATIVASILILPSAAQVRFAAGSTGAMVGRPATVGSGARGGAGGPVHMHHGHSGRGAVLYPYPYWYPDYENDSSEVVQPQVVVAPAAAPVPPPPATPLEPLLIEWQGDHFERMTLSQKSSGNGQSMPDYSESRLRSSASGSSSARKVVSPAPVELPPAVLVFRDGRKEEVSSYTIMNGTIYSKANYWTSGAWNKKIQVADLDVPATLKINQERGLNFVLPGSPNEVVVRP